MNVIYVSRWNIPHLSNANDDGMKAEEDEKKEEDDNKEDGNIYWELNPNDNSELVIKERGWYRIVFRCCIYHSSNIYARLYINGSAKDYCYHYNQSTSRYKSYNFNDIKQFQKNDKLKFYASTAAYKEPISSYFCIEKLPKAVEDSMGVWTSSSTSSSYRQWNNELKRSDNHFQRSDSNKNIVIQKGGVYRITARCHTYNSSSGNSYMQLYDYRNGSGHSLSNYQANSISSSYYECHMYDIIGTFQKDDYVRMGDNGYKTASNADYDTLSAHPVSFSHLVGYWKSSAQSNNIRRWDYELWSSDLLYKLHDSKTKIEVLERGFYRISAHVTNSQGNEEGNSSLYINEKEYAKSRMGCHSGTYYHTTSIQEIVSLKEGDKLHIWISKPYNSKDYNALFIEKLV